MNTGQRDRENILSLKFARFRLSRSTRETTLPLIRKAGEVYVIHTGRRISLLKGEENVLKSPQMKMILLSLSRHEDTFSFGCMPVHLNINGAELRTVVGRIPSFDDSFVVREKLEKCGGEIFFDPYRNSMVYIDCDTEVFGEIKHFMRLLLIDAGVGSPYFNPGYATVSPPPATPRSFTVYIETTTGCNLACKYCWAHGGRQNLNITRRKAEDIVEFVRKLSSRYGKERVSVLFEGRGEPLLNFEALRLIAEGVSGSVGHIGVVTNATLLNTEVLQFFSEKGISIGASVDFNEESHDAARVYRNGRGSFSRIYRNLKKAKRMGVRVGLSCTAHGKARNYHEVLGIAEKVGAHSITVRPCMYQGRAGKEMLADPEVFAEEYAELTRRRLKLIERGVFVRDSRMDGFLRSLMLGARIPRFCGAGSAILSITLDGKIYRCSHCVDDFFLGDIYGVDFSDLEIADRKIAVRFPDNPESRGMDGKQCFLCPYKALCGMGCYVEEKRYGSLRCVNWCRYMRVTGRRVIEMIVSEGFFESEDFIRAFLGSRRWTYG